MRSKSSHKTRCGEYSQAVETGNRPTNVPHFYFCGVLLLHSLVRSLCGARILIPAGFFDDYDKRLASAEVDEAERR